jgi:hypothetical protein
VFASRNFRENDFHFLALTLAVVSYSGFLVTSPPMTSTPALCGTCLFRRLPHFSGRCHSKKCRVPKPMIDSMISISSSDILWVDDFADGLGRPPSIAEWEDASCGSAGACKASACTCTARLLANYRDRLAPPPVQASLGACSYFFPRLCTSSH